MSFSSADVLNTVRRTIDKDFVRNKVKHERIFDKMLELNRFVKKQDGGNSREIGLIDSAGFAGQRLVSGLEQPARRTANISKMIKTTRQALAADMFIAYTEQRTLRQSDALLRNKAEEMHNNALQFILADLGAYFLTGESAGHVFPTSALSEMITLNGQKATGSLPGNERGLLSFNSVDLQLSGADSVQNLARTADIHFNQSAGCTNWATDGYKTVQEVFLKAEQRDHMAGATKGPDLMVGDLASYLNLLEERRGLVRISKDTDDLSDKSFHMAGFGSMEVTYSTYINPANYTAHAGNYDPSNGLFMLLPCKFIEYYSLLDGGKLIDMGNWQPSSTQRADFCRVDIDGNFIVRNLPAFGVVSNTAS